MEELWDTGEVKRTLANSRYGHETSRRVVRLWSASHDVSEDQACDSLEAVFGEAYADDDQQVDTRVVDWLDVLHTIWGELERHRAYMEATSGSGEGTGFKA